MLRLFYRRQKKLYIDTEALLNMAIASHVGPQDIHVLLEMRAGTRFEPLLEV